MLKLFAVPLALLVMAVSAHAQGAAPAAPPAAPANAPVEVKATGTPGKAAATRSEKVTATVKAVDVANRTITLQGPKGKEQTFRVGPQVQRLAEIAPGDKIVVEYEQGLMLEMQPPGSKPVQPEAAVVAGRGDASKAPAGGAMATVQATVTVSAIDMKNRIVVFQGPGGNLYQVKAGPKIKLEKLKVGDQLLATYVEAVAIAVEKPGAAAAPKK
jgi:Cu/Ag efflux protein CusF